jgi:predicted metal-dependent hydrolase
MSNTAFKAIAADIKATVEERGVIAYGEDVIRYEVIRRNADDSSANGKSITRKIIIKVHPDQRVVVTAPFNASNENIQSAVLKRIRWIWKNITEFALQHTYVLPRQYVSGETQFYLGRRYVLKVLINPEQSTSVKLNKGKLTVSLIKDINDRARQVQGLIDLWYLHRANSIFHERLQAMLPRTTWVKGIPSFRIMAMKKQWGSCSIKGSLLLNPHLVKASKECIDYVILHELCHIAEHNHSDKFWRLLTQVMPNWKEVKANLDGMAELYLNE